jgi:dihydroflavonol-4-reductase
MMKALITGGTGFVGSHIARALINNGDTPRILRRERSSLKALEGLAPTQLEHAIGDVTDPVALRAAMKDCEIVFHVAAVADYWRADKAHMYRVNVEGARNVFQIARESGVRRVIFTSSAAAIGSREDGSPANEGCYFNANPVRFPYAHTKFLAEAEAHRAIQAGSDIVILNPSVILGPGDVNQISGSTLIELKKGSVPAIPAGGVTLIDVRDVAANHLAAVKRGATGERYILGAYDVRWRDLMPLAAQVVGVEPPKFIVPEWAAEPLGAAVDVLRALRMPILIDGNQLRLSAENIFYDCRKSWEVFGSPQIRLREMLEDTYRWYVQSGVVSD